MGSKMELQLQGLLEPVLEANGYELVELQFIKEGQQWFLRLFIDHPRGISHEDCQIVSTKVSDKLDELDPIPQSYILEVSSPGIERPLKRKSDFLRFAGKIIELHTYAPLDGCKNFRGQLKGIQEDMIHLQLDESILSIPFAAVATAHLIYDF